MVRKRIMQGCEDVEVERYVLALPGLDDESLQLSQTSIAASCSAPCAHPAAKSMGPPPRLPLLQYAPCGHKCEFNVFLPTYPFAGMA